MRSSRMWPELLLFRGALFPRSSSAARQTAPPSLRSFLTSANSVTRVNGSLNSLKQSPLQLIRPRHSINSRFRSLRFKSDKPSSQRPDPTSHLGSPEPAPSISQRLKKLSREYGWTAVGLYLALSALDFPFCFLAVRYIGADTIGHYEHVVVGYFKGLLRIPFPNLGKEEVTESAAGEVAKATAREGDWTGQLQEAEARNEGSGASIWTQLTLAYVIHKSFIFVRVPLTAAILPKVVKTLRKWGWNVGKRSPKSG